MCYGLGMATSAHDITSWYDDLDTEAYSLGIGLDEMPAEAWHRARSAGLTPRSAALAAALGLDDDRYQ